MKYVLALTVILSVSGALVANLDTVYAAGTHAHTHDDAHKESPGTSGGHHDGAAHHQHDSWMPPPQEYASLKFENWADTTGAQRGGQIYMQQCVACHGIDGKGTGPAAAGLEHPPADLTNHFHSAPGKGDGYLFWRVSEGGVVEPFRSQKSAMPPFKGVLSESQRWDVLTYIHQEFHGGFSKGSTDDTTHGDKDNHHQPSRGD